MRTAILFVLIKKSDIHYKILPVYIEYLIKNCFKWILNHANMNACLWKKLMLCNIDSILK